MELLRSERASKAYIKEVESSKEQNKEGDDHLNSLTGDCFQNNVEQEQAMSDSSAEVEDLLGKILRIPWGTKATNLSMI